MNNRLAQLHDSIYQEVFVKNIDEQIDCSDNPDEWLFDFRRILMNGEVANNIAELFYEEYKDQYPFQLCSLEVAGVPLVTNFVQKFYNKGHHDINGFFIRKSRKKTGLQRMIEGEIKSGQDIIVIDDLCNTGSSFRRQISVLEELGFTVKEVWSILRFRDMDYYTHLSNRGITVRSLFELNDFTETSGGILENLVPNEPHTHHNLFKAQWKFQAQNPSLSMVVPKAQPILDGDILYTASDTGTMWAINQSDGSVVWSYTIAKHFGHKGIFSSPVVYKDILIFGAYDGNVYGLDKHTGKAIWINHDADSVGSSPAINPQDGIVYIGLEFGLIKKQGGIVALDANSGRTLWSDYNHKAYTHASPLYIPETNEVVIGSNEGIVYLYDGSSGNKKWQQTTFGGAWYDPTIHHGFGDGSIKMRPAYDHVRDYIVVCAVDSFMYILERSTGHIAYHHKSQFACWNTPLVYENKIYWTSLDKQLWCLDLDTFTILWNICPDETRIFANPVIIDDWLYVGTNSGRLHKIDPLTGEQMGYFQALERITNHILHNPQTEMYFLPTYANEIIALSKQEK